MPYLVNPDGDSGYGGIQEAQAVDQIDPACYGKTYPQQVVPE